MENHLDRNMHLPLYNVKAVSRMLGLRPVTLRAWERRYGLPSPKRNRQGYRMYSEHDLRTLRWLKQQIDAGLNISRAVEYLAEMRSAGNDPLSEVQVHQAAQPISLEQLCAHLEKALTSFDERTATESIRRAFALYAVEQVLMQVIQPALIHIGEAWHRDEIAIAVEHYASQFCLQHLMSMLASSTTAGHSGLILAACAPGEMHHIGLLMLVIMLRWRGWDVRYLGPALDLDRFVASLAPLRPKLILFSATRTESALRLLELNQLLNDFPPPKPIIVLGGQGFTGDQLPNPLPGLILDAPADEAVGIIENIMKHGYPRRDQQKTLDGEG